MELENFGKNALVCGSSRGIGKAAAIELSKLEFVNDVIFCNPDVSLRQIIRLSGMRASFTRGFFTHFFPMKVKKIF